MSAAVNVLWHSLRDAFLMGWEVWWALVLGFLVSAIVQAWVPRERIERSLSGGGLRPIATATGLGAASSSCSYAAVAIAKSLFEKGASAASALAFQLASTNPGLGARLRALGPDRLAVRTRRIPRRHCDDRRGGAAPAGLRLTAAGA